MLDCAPITPALVVPLHPSNPLYANLRFRAFVEGTDFSGAGEDELSVFFDLIELQVETGQPADDIAATIEATAALGAKALCDLIDWIGALDGAEPHMKAAIDRLHHIDPERAAERRAWL